MNGKLILSIMFSIMLSMVWGLSISPLVDVNPLAITGLLTAAQFIPNPHTGIAMAGVYREVWTGQVVEELSALEKDSFLDGIEDFSQYVSNVGDEMQVIHLVYMGVLPEVLINNTTYPISEQALGEEDIPISLDKYQTKVTPITDDELYALSYKKIEKVKSKHAKAIARAKPQKAIHSFAPASNTADMPVIVTTGDDDGTGRKKITKKDILTLKAKFDELEIPEEGRRLVLCTDHVNDLLEVDQAFENQYYNYTTGKIANMYSFDVYSYVGNPYYTPSTLVKLAYGAIPAATDRRASVAYSLERVAKASGWTKMYYSEAKTAPATQKNTVNFRHNYIALPTQEEARGAIVSDNVV